MNSWPSHRSLTWQKLHFFTMVLTSVILAPSLLGINSAAFPASIYSRFSINSGDETWAVIIKFNCHLWSTNGHNCGPALVVLSVKRCFPTPKLVFLESQDILLPKIHCTNHYITNPLGKGHLNQSFKSSSAHGSCPGFSPC